MCDSLSDGSAATGMSPMSTFPLIRLAAQSAGLSVVRITFLSNPVSVNPYKKGYVFAKLTADILIFSEDIMINMIMK